MERDTILLITRFNTNTSIIPIKFLASALEEIQKLILKCNENAKSAEQQKTILKKKNEVRDYMILNLKTYYKLKLSRSYVICIDTYTHEWNRKVSINRLIHRWSIYFHQGVKIIQYRKDSLFNKGYQHNWITKCETMNIDPSTSCAKWIIDLNARAKL